MIPGFKPPKKPPGSAVEAVSFANEVLLATGAQNARVTLECPPNEGALFAGARMHILLPENDLQGILAAAVKAKAAEHGAKVSEVTLKLSQADESAIRIQTSLHAKVMLSTLSIQTDGEVFVASPKHIAFRNVKLDSGSGMLSEWPPPWLALSYKGLKDVLFDLEQLLGLPEGIPEPVSLQINHFRLENRNLRVGITL